MSDDHPVIKWVGLATAVAGLLTAIIIGYTQIRSTTPSNGSSIEKSIDIPSGSEGTSITQEIVVPEVEEDPYFLDFEYDEDGDFFHGGYLYFEYENGYYRMHLDEGYTQWYNWTRGEWELDPTWD